LFLWASLRARHSTVDNVGPSIAQRDASPTSGASTQATPPTNLPTLQMTTTPTPNLPAQSQASPSDAGENGSSTAVLTLFTNVDGVIVFVNDHQQGVLSRGRALVLNVPP